MQAAQSNNLFTPAEQEAVRELMFQLSPTEFRVLALRVWGSYSIEDISNTLCVDWSRADSILSRAMKELRSLCLSHPAFAARLLKKDARPNFKESILEKEI